jgi:hypothetical protein
MSTGVGSSVWIPERRWWLASAMLVAVGLLTSWILAAALMVALFAHMVRPFDVIGAFLILVAGAGFVVNAGAAGALTGQLALLSCAILLVLGCYAISYHDCLIRIPNLMFAWLVTAFTVLSLSNGARGLLVGNSPRNLGLELISALALGSALIVANVFDRRRDLFVAFAGIVAIGFAVAAWGLWTFYLNPAHTISGYTVAFPGIVGLLLVNRAFRSRSGLGAVLWTVLSLPLFLHQLSTFGRGLWTGCIGGFLVSLLVFTGMGRGSGAAWRRATVVIATFAVVGLMAAAQLVVVLGKGDLLTEAGIRLASIVGTKPDIESRSNLIRLWEYATVVPLIQKSPWFGYGLGFTFANKEPFSAQIHDQWGVHQNFLLVWLKQGAIGLALFVGLLWSGITLGIRESRRRSDPLESTWFAGTAAATAFLAVFSLSNYPFAVVNETFLLALLWGGSMAMVKRGSFTVHWTPLSQPARAAQGPGDRLGGG